MSPLKDALDEYLIARRALGHKLRLVGRLLQRFVAFAEASGTTCVTIEIALAWAMSADKGAARPVGQPVGNGSPVCAILQRHRPEDRRTADRPSPSPVSSAVVPIHLS